MAYKYLQIEEFIKSQILSGGLKPGDKINSEAELISQFNISRQTVRTAISNLVKDGLLYTMQGKGTFVSDSKNKKDRSYLIGFATIRFEKYDIFPKIIKGINERTNREGYSLIIGETFNTIEGEYNCLKSFLEKGIDALILEPCKSSLPNPNITIFQEFSKRNIPILFFDSNRRDVEASYVITDDVNGSYAATQHLLDYGHRHICGIFKLDDSHGHQRFEGFCKAFRDYGLAIPEKNILWFSTEDDDCFWGTTDESCSYLDDHILQVLHGCTALVSYNDYVTVRITQLLKRTEISLQNDFSIVSFDDTDLISTAPVSISSVRHPGALMGEELGKAVISILNNPDERICRVLPLELVIRDSSHRIN